MDIIDTVLLLLMGGAVASFLVGIGFTIAYESLKEDYKNIVRKYEKLNYKYHNLKEIVNYEDK